MVGLAKARPNKKDLLRALQNTCMVIQTAYLDIPLCNYYSTIEERGDMGDFVQRSYGEVIVDIKKSIW